MTAEEIALEEFRSAVDLAKGHARISRGGAPSNVSEAFRRASKSRARGYRGKARSLARIIRAIRAERDLTGNLIHEASRYSHGKGYEQGLRDMARRVQGACWHERGRTKVNTEFAVGYHAALAEIAKAAEETAR